MNVVVVHSLFNSQNLRRKHPRIQCNMEDSEKFITNGNQLGYAIQDFQFLKTLGTSCKIESRDWDVWKSLFKQVKG